MNVHTPTIVVLAMLASLPAEAAAIDYGALWRYQGTWQVTAKSRAGKQDTLVNQCAVLGQYFACGQSVNGSAGGLLVFIPAGRPGHFYTQTIMPEGRATGRDDLEISGEQWIYMSRRDQDGKTTYFKTMNSFNGKNHIHFEQSQSTNGTQWDVQNSGDEVRVGAASPNAR